MYMLESLPRLGFSMKRLSDCPWQMKAERSAAMSTSAFWGSSQAVR
jgi:hypothetical protein